MVAVVGAGFASASVSRSVGPVNAHETTVVRGPALGVLAVVVAVVAAMGMRMIGGVVED